MSVDIIFPIVLVLVAAYFTLFRPSWSTVGTGSQLASAGSGAVARSAQPGHPEAAAAARPEPAPAPQQPAAPLVRLVPNEGFIPDDRYEQIVLAEMRLEGHIAYDRVQLRPGWLLFDPIQIIGQPPVVIHFGAAETGGKETAVYLYPVEDIRRLEREHSYLAQCRRASVQTRWDERKAARQARRTAA